MLYEYNNDFGSDLVFWSNATADLWHNGEIGENDLPDELQRALNELWTDSYWVNCYLVEFKGHYGIALEATYDAYFANTAICITYNELVNRANKKAEYVSKECPEFSVIFGKDTLHWSNGEINSQLIVFLPWDTHNDTFDAVAKWLDSTVYEV